MTSPIPERLIAAVEGRYAIQRVLGTGGMATVYLARDVKHERDVAIKVLREDLSASLGKERFLREVRIAAALQHPHVLPLYDSGEADGLLYYVMPFVDGMSLRDKLIKEGELPVSDAVRILRDIADALAEAHRHGVVHRDLKPENVMLRGRHALVTDFGVAKALSEATGRQSLTTIGVALGTPTYMAPEQATADPHVDHRADIYAFGVVAYELLAGRPPFAGSTPQQVLAAHVTATAEPVTVHRVLPPALSTLVMQCLEKKAADRPQSADVLIAQLEAVLTPSGGMTPTATQPLAALRAPRRSIIRYVIAGVAFAGIAAIAVWKLKPTAALPDITRVLVVPFEIVGDSSRVGPLAQVLEANIVQGLQRTGLGTASDSRSAITETSFQLPAGSSISSPVVARQLAERMRAGLMIVGRILVSGDTVRVGAKLLTSATGSEAVPIAEVTGVVSAMSGTSEIVAQRAMGAYALYRDPQWGATIPGISAPLYSAYRELQRGTEHFGRNEYSEAAERSRSAFAADPTFLLAAVRLGYSLYNAGDLRATDSLIKSLEARRNDLSPFETQYLRRLGAWVQGDYQLAHAAAREMARIAPNSNFARYTASRSALFVNRLVEGRDGLLTVNPNAPDMSGVDGYYSDVFQVYHLLGDHTKEAAVIKAWLANPRAQQQLSARDAEGALAAATGDIARASRVVEDLSSTRTQGRTPAVAFALTVLDELRWHGHDTAATRLAKGVLARMGESLTSSERSALMIRAGDLIAARSLADSALRANPKSQEAIVFRGMLAAAQADTQAATSAIAALRSEVPLYDKGTKAFALAYIYAQLGNRERATALLEQAFTEGVPFQGRSYHARFALEPLRGFPAFEVFIKPK